MKTDFGKFFILLMGVVYFSSCDKKDSTYTDYKPDTKYVAGSALDYLTSQAGIYDSLVYVIDLIPDLRDTLANEQLTIFGVTNESFKHAIDEVNALQKAQGLPAVYLKDIDRGYLDTLICRYLFKGITPIEDFMQNSEGLMLHGIKYGDQMHCQYERGNASGILGGGIQDLVFSYTKNSPLTANWESTTTKDLNLQTDNAVIYQLISGHIFAFNELIPKYIIKEDDEAL